MEQNVRDSAVLEAILDAAVDAIIVSEENGSILGANPAACQLFQYSADEMIGQKINMLMPNDMAKLHDSFMTNHITTGENKIIGIGRDVQGQRKDKSVFPLHLSVGKSTVAERKIFIGILHDLTNRKATQDALSRSQRLDAIGQMTGGIAHDFNNLLTVVIGNLELLQNRGADERQLGLINDALEAAELGADLTSRLMVFARKSNLQPVQADIGELCEDTLAILRRTLGSNYALTTDFPKNLDQVMIDPVQLQSALMNLAINARDAMGKRGKLHISVENVTIDEDYMAQETDIQPGRYVRLCVADDGSGMTPEAQQRAFEPFFSTKSDKGGTGLGLAMVYGFVRQSGGHVTLYSELGMGTNFGLYFPVVQVSTASDDNEKPAGVDGLDCKGRVVLVVEDNPKVRKLSLERVRDLGFETKEAETADEALEMLHSGLKVDVVFSDIVMPGNLNGFDLAEKIASEFPEIKILLTSGYASDVVSDTLRPDRSHVILQKPYRQSELSERFHALLQDASGD